MRSGLRCCNVRIQARRIQGVENAHWTLVFSERGTARLKPLRYMVRSKTSSTQYGQKSRFGHPTKVYQSSYPDTGSGLGHPGIPLASISSTSCFVGGTPLSEALRVVSGRTGLANDDGERASTGDVLANECRAGKAGLALSELGKLKLLVDGDPVRESVFDSCCTGISNDADLGPNAGYARSVGVYVVGVPGSSYTGYGSSLTNREPTRGTSGADSMRMDADSREGGFKVAVRGLPDVAAINELQSKSFGGICGILGILMVPIEEVGVPGRDPDTEGVPDDGALLPSRANS